MGSIVLELQAEAMDGDTNIGSLLRKSLAVATKLQLSEWIEWCKLELNGYPSGNSVPDYRQFHGEMKVFNPYNGIWMEISGMGPCSCSSCESIAKVQEFASAEGMIFQPVPPSMVKRIFGEHPITPPKVIVQPTSFVGILDAVRNVILDWTLKLESDGVLGDGMTFTQEEKKTVMKNETNYHIANFSGILGNVSGGNVQIGDYNQIEKKLKELKIPAAEREGLKQLMEELPKATQAKRRSIVKRGVEWTVRNGSALGALSDSIRGWFES